jgi:GNAT superfamily N-acetyltransferase
MAYRHGKPVGRIGACVDSLFNEFQDESWAWVGFFECFDDAEVAQALFDTAWQWAARRGVAKAVGPASFTTNDECGLLVDGFEHPPMVLTPQNPPYYEQLWTAAGWSPTMDLWGWRVDEPTMRLSDRQRRILERLKSRARVTVRSMKMADFDAEVDRFIEVYNSAWARNWGFVPMPEAEVRHLAKGLKQIIDPDLALVIEDEDQRPVAVTLALPDVNVPMRRVRSGRLLPIGWWHLLRGTKRADRGRVWALGVRLEHQNRALGPLMYAELADRMRAKGYQTAEASWILSTNGPMNTAIESLGGTRYKTWRMYEKDLATL